MRPWKITAFAITAACVLLAAGAAAAQTSSPAGAKVYIINLKNGDTVTSPFKVQFGLTGMGIASAGVEKPNTGHHHLIIDTKLSDDELKQPIASDAKHVHYGRRADRGDGHLAARATHLAARAGRLDAHPARAAGDVRGRHRHGEVRADAKSAYQLVASP
jgi:Domain of unknown function (DUF4399)